MIRKAILGAVVLVLLAGVAGLAANGWKRQQLEDTVPVVEGTISQVVVAIGRVAPVTEVVIANRIPGRIKAVLVREGDPVRIGQPVIRFDDEEYLAQARIAQTKIDATEAEVRRTERAVEAARARWVEAKSGARPQEIERARAEIEQAQWKWQNAEVERNRFKQLLADGLVARSQYEGLETEAEVAKSRMRAAAEALSLLLAGPKVETVEAAWAQVQEAEAGLTRAQSQVTQARAELEHAWAVMKTTVVESTVNGKVTKKIVEPGEAVDIGLPLMVLGDVSKTIVKAEVDETDVGKLSVEQPVEITVDAFPGRMFRGRVIEIGQAVGKRKVRPDDPVKIQDMKVLETKVEVLEGGSDLKLGMTVDVKIVGALKERVPVIPRALVPADGGETTLTVLGESGPESRRVLTGLRDNTHAEVTSGVNIGERVLVQKSGPPTAVGNRRP
jgi:ABC exporter DevB family membrane fusion protein